MDITTKYEIGSIVYAIHPCKLVYGGQVILNGDMPGMESAGTNQYPHMDDVYIVSPHRVIGITASCSGKFKIEAEYKLSGGITRSEMDVFASFEEAAGHAVVLYGKPAGKYVEAGKHDGLGNFGGNDMLKKMTCKKLQLALKTVLSCDQLERFEEEFLKATQGLIIMEA